MATLLLVEDDGSLAESVAKGLVAAGHRVEIARDGEAALRLFDRLSPDLVLLDWGLPRIDGLDVLRAIRERSAVPVLMLTARDDVADRVVGLELGADDYLVKPFAGRELEARVKALLRRGERLRTSLMAESTGDGADLVLGPLVVSAARHQATLAGREVPLTPQELALLRLLARHPGRAFSRSFLLESVWGGEGTDAGRAVDNAISRLRRKLGDAGAWIEPVWGVGYRLRAPE